MSTTHKNPSETYHTKMNEFISDGFRVITRLHKGIHKGMVLAKGDVQILVKFNGKVEYGHLRKMENNKLK